MNNKMLICKYIIAVLEVNEEGAQPGGPWAPVDGERLWLGTLYGSYGMWVCTGEREPVKNVSSGRCREQGNHLGTEAGKEAHELY
jgi:hypothetical protein